MARNRKSQSVAVRFGPAIKAAVICLLIGGSGVGYVWQKEQIVHLDRQMKERERTLHTLQEQNEKFQKQVANMQSVTFVDAKIQQLKLGLAPAQPAQIWRFPEPQPEDRPLPASGAYPLQASGRAKDR